MGKGKALSEFEKGRIEELLHQRISKREILKRLNRSKCVILNYSKNKKRYGQKKSSRRKKLLSKRDQRAILKIASNSSVTLSKIKHQLQLNVSKTTIWRTITYDPNIKSSTKKKKPLLTYDSTS